MSMWSGLTASPAKVLLCGVSVEEETVLGVPTGTDSVTVARVNADATELAALGDKAYDVVVAVARDHKLFTHTALLPHMARVLVPGGVYSHVEASSTERKSDDVNMELTFAGLMPPTDAATPIDGVGVAYIAHTPNYEVGAVAQLRRRPKKAAAATTEAQKVWTVLATDTALVDETALADEDDLLAEDVIEVKPAAPAAGGCATKRRACKNCSCGRKEMEEAAEKQAAAGAAAGAGAGSGAGALLPKEMPTSGCGNCSKGDAFRCATCPYLGQPAFEPGSVVKLDLTVSDF